MVFGAIIYLPFVHFGYVFKFMPKLTSFLQASLVITIDEQDEDIFPCEIRCFMKSKSP